MAFICSLCMQLYLDNLKYSHLFSKCSQTKMQAEICGKIKMEKDILSCLLCLFFNQDCEGIMHVIFRYFSPQFYTVIHWKYYR